MSNDGFCLVDIGVGMSEFSLKYFFRSFLFRTRYHDLWKICSFFTQFNTFVYQDKRIYIELEDQRKIYSVKVMPSNVICLRVPLKSYLRIHKARMSASIIRDALRIREKFEMNKNKKSQRNNIDQLLKRVVKMENTLETIEATLKAISEKLNQN